MAINNQKTSVILLILGIGLIITSYTAQFVFVIVLSQNSNENHTETLGTGQKEVAVRATNGTVVDVPPAESVNSLLNFITATLIPSIIGLIMAAVALIKLLPLSKKQKEGIEKGEKALIYVDTLAPKISDQFFRSGATRTAIELIANELDRASPGIKEQIMRKLQPTKDIEAQLRETEAQIKKLRDQLKYQERADNQPDIPRLSDGTVT